MRTLMILLSIGALSGCSSISSSVTESAAQGLTYYLPKKDVAISVVVTGGKITSVGIDTTLAYPDVTQQFVLNHSSNLIGKNILNVGVGVNGLLSTAKSTTTSGLSDIATGIAATIGTLRPLFAPPEPSATSCSEGTHVYILKIDELPQPFCGLQITVARIGTNKVGAIESAKGQSYSGIFYKQAQPYLVKVSGGFDTAGLVFSPSNSPVRFLPVARTLFSNNVADLGFTDGMPIKYDQDTDGEIVALIKLPAAIVSAYFAAIGNVFNSFKTTDNSQADSITTALKLEALKQKAAACSIALQQKDDTTFQKLQCGT